MGRHHVPLQAFLIALAAPAFGEAPSGVVPDVVIQADGARPVTREKPPLELPVKRDQPLESDVADDDGVRGRVPADLSRTAALAPGVAQSPLAVAPPTNWIVALWRGEPVRALYPEKELKAAGIKTAKDGKWELVVADSEGKAFRKWSGEGAPPERIDFDGKGDDGRWLAVGHAYTPVLTYRDASGRARTAMSRPFAAAGLAFDAPRSVQLAPRALFTGAATPELSEDGRALLREAALALTRRQPGTPLQLGVHLGRDAAWTKAAGEACVKELAKALLLKPEAIALVPSPGTPDLAERLELSAVTR